jgi:fatty acid desaturase
MLGGDHEVMTMLTTHSAPTTIAERRPAVPPVRLAAIVSIVAVVVAVVLHTVAGVAETPLVVGTLVVASLAGWVNAERQART